MHQLVTIEELSQQAKERGRPVTPSYLRRLCRDKRILGASKIGTTWAIPASYAERWLTEWTTRAE